MPGFGLGIGLWHGRRRVGAANTSAPAVRQVISVSGDSWTAGGSAKQSRLGKGIYTESDRWDYQLAAALGATNYTSPTQSSAITSGVINCGFGGFTSPDIMDQVQSITTADAGRLQDSWTFWGGRNEVSSPGGANFGAITIAQAARFLTMIPHERKLLFNPYAGAGSGSQNWARMKQVHYDYTRNKRKYYVPLRLAFMSLSPNGSNGTDAENVQVAGETCPTSMFASAATEQDHPNYLSSPLISAYVLPVMQAMQNKAVYVQDQSIPDAARDMTAGTTLEVYGKGYITSWAITTDDAVNPGLFTISAKPGSTDTALLTRTAVSSGVIPEILNLSVTASGMDTAGTAKTATGKVRILPSVIGAASTVAVGVTLPRDPHATATSRRWPFMMSAENPFTGGPRLTIVMSWKPGEDSTNQNIFSIGFGGNNAVLLNRTSANKLTIRVRDTAAADLVNWTSLTVNFTIAGGPVWIAFSIDASLGTPTAHLWAWQAGADTSIAAASAPAAGNQVINHAGGFPFWFSASTAAQSSFKGSIRTWWMDDRYIDFSIAGNRRLFWDLATGSPVDLGADGSTGLTSAPKYYLRGCQGDWIMGKNFGTAPNLATVDNWGRGFAASSDPTAF